MRMARIFFAIIHLVIFQTLASGLCDFIAQCIMVRLNHCTYLNFYFYLPKSSKIYRCWMVWGQNIRVVIIPSFLAIAYIGQSISLYLISQFQLIASSCLARVRIPIATTSRNRPITGIHIQLSSRRVV